MASAEGNVVTVKFQGIEKKIIISPNSLIFTYLPGTRDELKAGAAVAVSGSMKSGTTLEATRIVVGRDGVVPN